MTMIYFISDKGTLSRRQVYTIELSPTETNVSSESSLKPMTPRRVKRRSGSRGAGSSVRRSRRSYRNAGYLSSNASLPHDSRPSRPTSAHSSYSNFHGARPSSYHPEREQIPNTQDYPPPPVESIPIITNRCDTIRRPKNQSGRDVVGPYNEPPRSFETSTYSNIGYEAASYENRVVERESAACESYEAWEPPAPPYGTPQAPGPPAYQPAYTPNETHTYNMVP